MQKFYINGKIKLVPHVNTTFISAEKYARNSQGVNGIIQGITNKKKVPDLNRSATSVLASILAMNPNTKIDKRPKNGLNFQFYISDDQVANWGDFLQKLYVNLPGQNLKPNCNNRVSNTFLLAQINYFKTDPRIHDMDLSAKRHVFGYIHIPFGTPLPEGFNLKDTIENLLLNPQLGNSRKVILFRYETERNIFFWHDLPKLLNNIDISKGVINYPFDAVNASVSRMQSQKSALETTVRNYENIIIKNPTQFY